MTDEILSPMSSLVSLLLSLGVPGKSLPDVIALAELAFGTTRSSASRADERERWRLKKAAQRARRGGQSPGTIPDPMSSKTQEVVKKEVKKEPRCPPVPGDTLGPADDWPDDFLEQFWSAFPPFRKQAKAKVGAKLARIRTQTGKQKVTWASLFGGVMKFAATNPGEYAPAPMVWLNDGRWDREYGTQQGGSNEANRSGGAGGKVGFAGVAARLRAARDGELPPDEPAGDPRR